MIGNAQVGGRLGIARDALVDVAIRDAVDLADARRRLSWVRLSPWGRGRADSVEGRVRLATDGIAGLGPMVAPCSPPRNRIRRSNASGRPSRRSRARRS